MTAPATLPCFGLRSAGIGHRIENLRASFRPRAGVLGRVDRVSA